MVVCGRARSFFALAWLGAGCGPAVALDESSSSGSSGTVGEPTAVGSTSVVSTATTGVGDGSVGADEVTGDGEAKLDVLIPDDCSTIEQDCPPGYKCMPYSNGGNSYWNDRRCAPIVDEPAGVGEPCVAFGNGFSGADTCDGTSMCWELDLRTLEGVCAPFCVGTDDAPTCADPCDSCVIGPEGFLALCFFPCDPILQDCVRGQACFPLDDTFTCAPDESAIELQIGSPCEYVNGCPMGAACIEASAVPGCTDGSPGCCAPFCEVGGVDPCPELLPGTVCTPWFEDGEGPPQGCLSGPVGVCRVP